MSYISVRGEQSDEGEIQTLSNLSALAISGQNQFVRKTGIDTFENATAVTSVSILSANGFAGTVANATTTPAITLTTTITGLLKGNGTAISAANDGTDYLSSTTGLKLDQTTPQTLTTSPIFDNLTAGRIPFASATKTLTDDSNLFWDSANSRLGVNTTTPGASLDIGGDSILVLGINGTAKVLIKDDVNAISGLQMTNVNAGGSAGFRFLIKDPTGHYFAFSQAGTGNAQTNIFGLAQATTDFIFNTGGTARNMGIGTASATNLTLGTNNTARVTILSNGNVGVGTATPVSNFELRGVSTTRGPILTMSTSDVTIVATNTLGTINFVAPLEASREDANLTAASISAVASGSFTTTANPCDLVFSTAVSEVATEKMRLTSAGYLGIGTTNATEKLTVYGNVAMTGTIKQNSITKTISGSKVLTDGSATGMFEVAVGTGELIGGDVYYTIYVTDGTDFQAHNGSIGFVAVNKAGTVTSDCKETYSPSTEVEIATSGTLTDEVTCTDGAGKVTLNMNADTSLAGATITVKYTVILHSMNVITLL